MHLSFWLFKWKSNALFVTEQQQVVKGCSVLRPICLGFFLLCFSFPRCLNALQVLDLFSVTSVYSICVHNIKHKNSGATVVRILKLYGQREITAYNLTYLKDCLGWSCFCLNLLWLGNLLCQIWYKYSVCVRALYQKL